VASLSQGRTAAAQCGLFTHKSVPVIFEPPCIMLHSSCIYAADNNIEKWNMHWIFNGHYFRNLSTTDYE